MLESQTLTEERLWGDLETEVRPLLAVIRVALSEVMAAPVQEAVGRFLDVAPVEACVRLAEAWSLAAAVGAPTDQFKTRFGPEDQFLIELVTSVYTPVARPRRDTGEFLDMPELARLLDEIGSLG